jgi:spermidine synthase
VTVFATKPKGRGIKKQLWVNGVGMTALVTVTKMMAHLPIMLGPPPEPGRTRKVLVICFGMGTTVRSASRWPDTEVEAVELVPSVIRALPFFHADAAALYANPRVRMRVGDGRNWLLLSGRRYDVITVDPAPPIWSAGTVNLYSREFMALARDALTENGVAQFWVSSVVTKQELRMLLATFRAVFPQGTVWSGDKISGYYLIGARRGALRVDPARIRAAYAIPAVRADILEWDDSVGTPEKVMALYAAGARRMASFSAGAPLVTDDHPWIEFPLFRYLVQGDGRFPRRLFLAERDPIEEVIAMPVVTPVVTP